MQAKQLLGNYGESFRTVSHKIIAKHFEHATGSQLVTWFGVAYALGGVSYYLNVISVNLS